LVMVHHRGTGDTEDNDAVTLSVLLCPRALW